MYLLQHAHSHLDGGRGSVRIIGFHFSSMFNTIQHSLLSEKLLWVNVSVMTVTFAADYLSDRLQFVQQGSTMFDVAIINMGVP